MSDNISPKPAVPSDADLATKLRKEQEPASPWADVLSPSRAKKALSAGAAATIVAVGGVTATAFSDGAVSAEEVAFVVGSGAVAFVGAFFAAYFPTNAPS